MFRYWYRGFTISRCIHASALNRNYTRVRYVHIHLTKRDIIKNVVEKALHISRATSEKFPIFVVYLVSTLFLSVRRCNAIKLGGIFIRGYGILIGIFRGSTIFLDPFHAVKRETGDQSAVKWILWSFESLPDSSQASFLTKSALYAAWKVCNWIRLYLHWFPSCAPNATSIFASGLLLLSTATSSGDKPSLLTL